MKQQRDEPVYKDPVCGMEVSRKSAVAEYAYQGKTYYFCAGSCRDTFEANPEKYIQPQRQKGMKPR